MSCVELRRGALNIKHSNIAIKIRVYRSAQQVSFEVTFDEEVGNLSLCMHAGIGAPRSVNGYVAMIEHRQSSRKLTLDGAAIRLNLPAMVIRAVILNCHPEVLHG